MRAGGLLATLTALVCASCKPHPPPPDPGVEAGVHAPPGSAGGDSDASAVPAPAQRVPLVPASITPPTPPPRAFGASYPPFKKTSLPLEQLAQMVESAPELARLGGSIALFDPGDNPYLRRSKADHEGYTITPLPVLWSPLDGEQVLVVVGRGKEGSFVAAWWPLPGGEYRLASAFVMLGEVAPVALAYRPSERTLAWTTCWRCGGEMGHLDVRDDGRVVIRQD